MARRFEVIADNVERLARGEPPATLVHRAP
jgi:hypothetical protein